jgi:predicted transcriptional regulator
MRDEVYENFLRSMFEEEDKSLKNKKYNKKDIQLLENNFNKIIMNLSEIYIDNPNIVSILKKFNTLIEEFVIFDLQLHNQFNELIDTQSKLIEDDDEDDNFF